MKVLVFSDSHSSLRFMRQCVDAVNPTAIIHLGDHYGDGQAIAEENPDTLFFQVPGNCDLHRCPPFVPEMLIQKVCGVPMYMTHGHVHGVKQTLSMLLRDARASGVDMVLFGHTHEPYLNQEEDGLWVMNPGSSGYYGGSAGLIEIQSRKIISCRLLGQDDLGVMK